MSMMYVIEPRNILSPTKGDVIVTDGEAYQSVIHYVLCQKALMFGSEVLRDRVLATRDVAEQRRIASTAIKYDAKTWYAELPSLVLKASILKFSNNIEELRFLTEIVNSCSSVIYADRADKDLSIGISSRDLDAGKPWSGRGVYGMILPMVPKYILTTSDVFLRYSRKDEAWVLKK